jgi:carbamoyltransferase
MDYFEYPVGLKMTNNNFNNLFDGPPRQPESRLTQREMDLARSVQEVTEEIMVRMATHVKKETNKKYLCLAGGVALNCVGNGKLLRSRLFEDIWIQPAAGDAGGALGAAYLAYHHYAGKPVIKDSGVNKQKGSYLGTSYHNKEIESFLNKHKIPYKKQTEEKIIEETSKLLAEENIIGWFQGKMEFGPRALGNRSIIGDARSAQMQKKMNLKIKFRESFRPFAPAVLAEEVQNWFEIDRESPYMLLVADIKSDKKRMMDKSEQKLWGIDQLNVVRSQIPAVTHVDYSARIQTVDKNDNPLFHKLIDQFFKITGCPVIVNTSFNVRGEPIVESPLDAFKCFMRTEMDILVIGNYILYKSDQPEFHDDINWREVYELD